jgi:hypothetical protein
VTGEVLAICAAQDVWGTGTVRAPMGSAVAELARLGYADAILWVLDSNDRAPVLRPRWMGGRRHG